MISGNIMKMVDSVFNAVKEYPRNIAFDFMGKKTTYSKMAEKIERVAKSLSAIGLTDGDIMCVVMPNTPQAVLTIYACNKIGVSVNMIHPLSSENELLSFINRVNASTVLILDEFYNKIKNIRKETQLKNVIVAKVEDEFPLVKKIGYKLITKSPNLKGEDVILWKDFLEYGDKNINPATATKNQIALILHSGGTTGKIKGVCLSNDAVNCCAEQMIKANPMIDSSDRFLSVMPISHGYGLVVGVHTALMSGVTCVLIPRFTPKTYAKVLIKNKCNYMSGVPALFERLMDVKAMQKADLSFLKCVLSGADYLSVELERKINAFLVAHNSPVKVRQGYGMTEGVAAITLNPPEIQKEGSIGIPLSGVEVKIVQPNTENELAAGEIGEIVFSSSTNMTGYYQDPEETSITMKKRHSDGKLWIHSGDLGIRDADGFFYFKGRIKRMIVANGYNVFPNELENIIEGNDKVDRCCVLSMPFSEGTEKIQAFILLKNGVSPTEKTKVEILEYSKNNIAKYALPKKITFVAEMPKTKVGKIDFNALKSGDFTEVKTEE